MAHLYSFIFSVVFFVILFVTPSFSQDSDSINPAPVLNAKDPKHRDASEGTEKEHPTQVSSHRIPVEATSKSAIRKGFRLADLPECHDDVAQFCPKEVNRNNNFQVLTCLQDNAKEDDLSDDCHMVLWDYKYNLTHDGKFEIPAKDVCQNSLKLLPDCEGESSMLPCLLENRQNVTDKQCRHFLTKLQSIYFSDHRLVEPFIKNCGNDVRKFSCGRIGVDPTDRKDVKIEDLHSQGEVIECLEDKIQELENNCREQIFRMAELQSDDYHLDRALFYACRGDREKFCADVAAGDGRVYKCLMKNKFHDKMTSKCKDKLTVRQKIIAKDFKAQYPLMKSCRADYKKYNCKKGDNPHESLANLLLCLQEQISLGKPVDPDCQNEITEAAQELMEDYSLNPEVVSECGNEIKDYCDNGLKKEGETLDCLMKIGEEQKPGKKLSKGCEKAITNLLKETGAAGDYRIDHTLAVACEPVVNHLCKEHVNGKEGDIMIVSCLMENLYAKDMDQTCRSQLLHLQFFVSRDFRLDPRLFKVCNQDAEVVCHAKNWNEEHDLPQGMVMSCLHRNSLPGAETKISTKCASVVRNIMHQRAMDVHLMPEVQDRCLIDLGTHCTDKVEKGEEVECLQSNYDKLTPQCQAAVGNFTEEEAEDFELDKSLVKACGPMVTKFCQEAVAQGDTDEIIPCLIANKNNVQMNFKCRAGVEHWQLLEMKDFKFSPLFKEACKKDVKEFCSDAKKKADVIKCLSTHIHGAIMTDQGHQISKKCRSQIRVELLEQSEDIRLNPDMYGGCQEDVKKFCSQIPPGNAAVIECLKDHQEQLKQECHIQIYNREKAEAADRGIDYAFMKACKKMIKMHCGDHTTPENVFSCLKKLKNDEDMDPKCRNVITKRQKIMSKDIRLNPEMDVNCKRDVTKFCSKELAAAKDGVHNEGKIISCLKKNKERLSEDCEFYVRNLERDAVLDYRLDPVLAKECEGEIRKLCGDIVPGKGEMEKCLKNNLIKITSNMCLVQLVRVLQESETDIFVDPFLHQSCMSDVNKHCADVRHGNGRVMKCLLEVAAMSKSKLSKDCKKQLTVRAELWETMKKMEVPVPQSVVDLPQLMGIVSSSPSRNYFYIIFLVCLTFIFIGGLFFGRFTRRVRQEFKSR